MVTTATPTGVMLMALILYVIAEHLFLSTVRSAAPAAAGNRLRGRALSPRERVSSPAQTISALLEVGELCCTGTQGVFRLAAFLGACPEEWWRLCPVMIVIVAMGATTAVIMAGLVMIGVVMAALLIYRAFTVKIFMIQAALTRMIAACMIA